MIIAITGTPGSGKTYVAEKIEKAAKGRLELLDLNKYIKDKKLYSSYDRTAQTYDVDTISLNKKVAPMLKKFHSNNKTFDRLSGKNLKLTELIAIISKLSKEKKEKGLNGVIVDSHLSHYLDCDYCIVVRSDIKKINKRLKARKYPAKKIEDNIQSEIFEICLDEARNAGHKIILINN